MALLTQKVNRLRVNLFLSRALLFRLPHFEQIFVPLFYNVRDSLVGRAKQAGCMCDTALCSQESIFDEVVFVTPYIVYATVCKSSLRAARR
jgi:hypothetical protein